MASIALSPAIEIKKLAIVNIKSQLLQLIFVIVEKYSLQQHKSPIQVLRHAITNISPKIIIPTFPKRKETRFVRTSAPFDASAKEPPETAPVCARAE